MNGGERSSRAEPNPAGNARLTAAVGLLVAAPVLIEAASVLLGVHSFMSVHVFVGFVLIPIVLLKLGSTGWRFARYYLRAPAYLEGGPPQILMRLLAPVFVLATVVLFGSGVAMGFLHGEALRIARQLHGPASVIWLVLLGLHVLVYAGRAWRYAMRDVRRVQPDLVRGRPGRARAIVAVVISGFVLAAATVPAQHRWIELPRDHHAER